MKIRVAALIFTVVFLVQGTLLNMIDIGGVTPNLILCLVIALTFFYENELAIYLGVVFGIIADICFSDMVGMASLAYLVVGFLIVKVRNTLNKESLISSVILGLSGTLLFNFFCWALRQLLGNSYDLIQFLKLQPLYLLYNLMVMIFLYFIFVNRVVRHRSDRYYR